HDEVAAVAENLVVGQGRGFRLLCHWLYLRCHFSLRRVLFGRRQRASEPKRKMPAFPAEHAGTRKNAGRPGRYSRTSAGDGGDDAHDVAVLRRRVLSLQITNVFVVDVDVDEAAQLAVFREQVLAQIGKFLSQATESLTNSRGADFRRVTLPGIDAKRSWNHDFYWHFWSPRNLSSWSVLADRDFFLRVCRTVV